MKRIFAMLLSFIIISSILTAEAVSFADAPAYENIENTESEEIPWAAEETNEGEPEYVEIAEDSFDDTAVSTRYENRVLNSGSVTVSGLLPVDAVLAVVEVNPESYEHLVESDTEVAFAYDISILRANKEWKPIEPLTVKIKVQTATGKEMSILHLENNEAALPEIVEDISAATSNGEIVFDTFSFSVFIGASLNAETARGNGEKIPVVFPPQFEKTAEVGAPAQVIEEAESNMMQIICISAAAITVLGALLAVKFKKRIETTTGNI